jgi:hypothetical protein
MPDNSSSPPGIENPVNMLRKTSTISYLPAEERLSQQKPYTKESLADLA